MAPGGHSLDSAVHAIPDNVCFLSFVVAAAAGRWAGSGHAAVHAGTQKAGAEHDVHQDHGRAGVRPGAGNGGLLSVPVLAGVGYLVAWVVSQLVGAPAPSIAASGAQVVTSFAGRGGPNMAMFVLAEGSPRSPWRSS